MDGWQNVGLVLAGSFGPLVIALVNLRSARRLEALRWHRDDQARTHDLYARFLGACTQVIADWSDFAHLPPRDAAEERDMDERRDAHYAELNTCAAMVRLAAPPPAAAAAEEVLAAVRSAQRSAREATRTAGQRGAGDDRWPEVEAAFAEARTSFVQAARRVGGGLVVAA